MKTVDLENRLVRVNPIHLYRFVNSKDCGFRNFICELKDLSKAIEVVNACMEKVKNMKGSTKEEAEKLKIFLKGLGASFLPKTTIAMDGGKAGARYVVSHSPLAWEGDRWKIYECWGCGHTEIGYINAQQKCTLYEMEKQNNILKYI